MNVTAIRDTLLSVCKNTYHYIAPAEIQNKYIVWGETGVDMRLNADNGTRFAAVSGEILYYTDVEYDGTVDEITSAFDGTACVCNLTGAGYDYDLQRIVYTYTFEVSCGDCNLYA